MRFWVHESSDGRVDLTTRFFWSAGKIEAMHFWARTNIKSFFTSYSPKKMERRKL